MAGVTTTTLSGHLQALAPQVIVDTVERKSPLMQLFGPYDFSMGGDGPEWRVNYAGNSSAGSYVEGASEPAAGYQAYMKAKQDWAYTWVIYRISRRSLDQTRGDESLIGNLLAQEVNKGALDGVRDLEKQILGTAAGTDDMDSTAAAIQTSGTYASIDASTYTWWQAGATTTVGALAEADLQAAGADLRSVAHDAMPDLALCGSTVFNIVGNLIDSNQQVVVVAGADSGGKGWTLEGGFRHLRYEGIVYLEIPGYTAQRIDIIQSDLWKLYGIRDWMTDPLAIDGDDLKSKTTVGGQLSCLDPGKTHTLTGITS